MGMSLLRLKRGSDGSLDKKKSDRPDLIKKKRSTLGLGDEEVPGEVHTIVTERAAQGTHAPEGSMIGGEAEGSRSSPGAGG